jgi:hypothetical protein
MALFAGEQHGVPLTRDGSALGFLDTMSFTLRPFVWMSCALPFTED